MTTTEPMSPLSTAAQRERHEFAMGRTDTLSRAALIAAVQDAIDTGKRDHPKDGYFHAAAWGTLLGALGSGVTDAIKQ